THELTGAIWSFAHLFPSVGSVSQNQVAHRQMPCSPKPSRSFKTLRKPRRPSVCGLQPRTKKTHRVADRFAFTIRKKRNRKTHARIMLRMTTRHNITFRCRIHGKLLPQL